MELGVEMPLEVAHEEHDRAADFIIRKESAFHPKIDAARSLIQDFGYLEFGEVAFVVLRARLRLVASGFFDGHARCPDRMFG